MKEIIPLKKDIIFKSKVYEITSIDVEHNFNIKDSVVDGFILLSGSYKMTEASLIEEDFYYEIPFSIAISEDIIKESINIEISDFKYKIEKDLMKVDVLLEFSCEKEDIKEDIMEYNNDLDDYFNDENEESFEETNNNIVNSEDTINNITNNIINNEEKYNTYKVYIVRENDTIDTICTKYNINYEDLVEYNNLNEINVGDKIIIPYINSD